LLLSLFLFLSYFVLFYFILFYFICNTGGYTPGLVLAREELNHLSHTSSPFWVGYFEIEFHFMPRWPDQDRSICAFLHKWNDRHKLSAPSHWSIWSLFFSHDSPNFCLPSCWDYRQEPMHPPHLRVLSTVIAMLHATLPVTEMELRHLPGTQYLPAPEKNIAQL
jgi:hypothetical protein